MIPNFSLSRQKASCSINRVTKACFPTDSSHLCLDPSFRSVTLTPSSPSSLLKVYYEVFIRAVIHIYKYDDWSPAVTKEHVEPLSCALLSCGEASGLSASVSPVPSFPETCWDSVIFETSAASLKCLQSPIDSKAGGGSLSGRWTDKQTVLLPKFCCLRQPCKKEIARLF